MMRSGNSALLTNHVRERWAVTAWWVIFLMLAVIPPLTLILMDANGGRAAYDSIIYHERVIRDYALNWPDLNLKNPLTTTIPGYHVLLAAISRFFTGDPTALRLVNLGIGTAFLVIAALTMGRWAGARNGLLLCMPLAACSYVLGASAWLLPDNISWLLVLLCMTSILSRGPFLRTMFISGTLLLAAVAVRQVNIWMASIVAISAMMGDWPDLEKSRRNLGVRASVALVVVAPSFVLVYAFARTWGGLTPPRFQADVSGFNLATPAFLLFQFAALGFFFLPWLWGSCMDFVRRHRVATIVISSATLLIASLPRTAPGEQWGRFAGWWRLLEALPVWGGWCSIPIVLLAPLGALLLAGSISGINARARIVVPIALVAFAAAMTCTFYSWQRYHEPFVLMTLAILASLQPKRSESGHRVTSRIVLIGTLTTVLSLLTYANMSAERIDRSEPPAIFHLSEEERKAWHYDTWIQANPNSRQSRELSEIRKLPDAKR